ncbi:MAG: hypothetical protein PUE12_18110 [Oscillospiraceae bacterium]|nr:hypothetical protein [Oscillospiraceae bacterium]
MNKKNCNVGCPDCEEICKTKGVTKKSKTTNDSHRYKCAICGKNYNTIEERIKCEINCVTERKEVEKKMKEEQLKSDEQARYDHIKTLLSEANDEIKAYLNDYESFSIDTNYYYLRYVFRFPIWF